MGEYGRALQGQPALTDDLGRLSARPAFQKVYAG